MAKESWGIKRTCPCGNGLRFYDLNKKEIECPSCGENINVELLTISTLENNLRKKPKVEIAEEQVTEANDKIAKDKNVDIEIDTDEDLKEEVKEIIGKKKIKDEEEEK